MGLVFMGKSRIHAVAALVPAAAVVGIFFVDGAALVVKADNASLFAHVDFEFASGAAALPAIVLVAQSVPAFAHRERNPLPRGGLDEDDPGGRAAQLSKGVHALLPEQECHRNQGVNDS